MALPDGDPAVVPVAQPPDVFDPGMAADPYPVYDALRLGPPVAHDTKRDVWIVHRYADARAVLRDRESFSSRLASFERTLLGADGTGHDRVRRALASSFSPLGVERLRAVATREVDRALDAIAERGSGDVIGDLALPLAQTVVGRMIGLPPAAWPSLHAWSQAIAGASEASVVQALKAPSRILREHLAGFRAEAAPLAVAALDESHADLTLDQRVDLALILIVGGLETTASVIGHAAEHLSRRPRLADKLREDADRIGPFLEEVMRYHPPVQRVLRRTVRATRVAGQDIPARSKVLVLIGAANRDPAKFSQADQFRPRRAPNEHLVFGSGAHSCVGLWLARMEAALAIGGLLRRFPHFELAGPVGPPAHPGVLSLAGLARVEIAVGASGPSGP